MTRPALLLLPLLGLAACTTVPPPVCAQPEVLQLLSERLQRAGQAQTIQAGSVNQRPGPRPGLVACAVRVDTAVYDIGRFGPAPLMVQTVVDYAIEMRTNGAFLLPEAPPQMGVARRSM